MTGLTWNAALSIEGGNKPSGGDSNGYQAVDEVVVVHNSFVNCRKSIYLSKKHGKRKPTGVFANNLVAVLDSKDNRHETLVDAQLETSGVTWQSNFFFGLSSGLANISESADPRLQLKNGAWQPTNASPLLDSATGDYPVAKLDIDGRERSPNARDIGAFEFESNADDKSDRPAGRVGTNFLDVK